MDIKKTVSRLDAKLYPLVEIICRSACEVSSDESDEKLRAPIATAIRYIGLLDLYQETFDRRYANYLEGAEAYKEEAERQRKLLYGMVPAQHRKSLEALEKKVLWFFAYESKLRFRLKKGGRFTESEILHYIRARAGDDVFYGKIARMFVPEWNLTGELHINTMLYDTRKDLTLDYEEDLKDELPNVLSLYLSGRVKGGLPKDIEKAKNIAGKLGVRKRILGLARRLKGEALESGGLEKAPFLKKALLERHGGIVRALA